MIHYHGTPITPEAAAVQILRGRHAFVSFAYPEQIVVVAEICQSFALDNGAFSFWTQGKTTDWNNYVHWASEWGNHPACDFVLIPDVIDGTEEENDCLLDWWRDNWNWPPHAGVPVWHLHESLERLTRLAFSYPRIAFGSSGEYERVGTEMWWHRMREAMRVVCIDGLPVTKLHGLRMLNPKVFSKLPFASADSTNIARNIGIDVNWRGKNGNSKPPSKGARGLVIADRVEAHQSAPFWKEDAA